MGGLHDPLGRMKKQKQDRVTADTVPPGAKGAPGSWLQLHHGL